MPAVTTTVQFCHPPSVARRGVPPKGLRTTPGGDQRLLTGDRRPSSVGAMETDQSSGSSRNSDAVTVLLGGDVMLGRGVDQILPHPGEPELREPYLRDARGYVRLAEHANGPIPRPVDWRWPWGEALALLDEAAPAVRLINLETTITADGEFAERKAVCYRMHPDNLPALTALQPDICALANNHILDFGYQGLTDTVAALGAAGIQGVEGV